MLRPAAGIGVMALVAVTLVPAVAHADTYRYWSYWTGGDQWSYSARGPGFRVPPDAGVEGWRFVVSPKDGSQASPPGAAASYEQLCPGQPPAPNGQKRVAVVLDYGPTGIAPVGQTPPEPAVSCVTVPATDNGLQVLQRVAMLRFHTSGLICGVNGFPATECPGQTQTSTRSSAAPRAGASPAPVSPVVPAEPAAPATSGRRTTERPSPTPTPPPRPMPPSTAPSPVALALPEEPPPAAGTTPPAWIAAIGVTMIAALLGLALLVRRGRG